MDNRTEVRFGVCIKNEDCADLELCKIYEILPDQKAAEDDYVRVIDESGEDYLYPAEFFCPLEVPQVVQDTVRLAA